MDEEFTKIMQNTDPPPEQAWGIGISGRKSTVVKTKDCT